MAEKEVKKKEKEVKATEVKNKSKKEKVKKEKVKKDHRKLFLRILIVLLILELLAIPGFIFAGMNQVIPIVLFIILPTVFAIAIVLLASSCLKSSLKEEKSDSVVPQNTKK